MTPSHHSHILRWHTTRKGGIFHFKNFFDLYAGLFCCGFMMVVWQNMALISNGTNKKIKLCKKT